MKGIRTPLVLALLASLALLFSMGATRTKNIPCSKDIDAKRRTA
jgi:hypothetical protein